jgi:hypothetical protein
MSEQRPVGCVQLRGPTGRCNSCPRIRTHTCMNTENSRCVCVARTTMTRRETTRHRCAQHVMRTPIMLLQAHERTHAHALSMHARGQMVAWRTVICSSSLTSIAQVFGWAQRDWQSRSALGRIDHADVTASGSSEKDNSSQSARKHAVCHDG